MVSEAKANGQTVFLSSHILSEIQTAADQVAILRSGRIVSVSDVDSLRETAIRHVRIGVTDATASPILDALSHVPGLTGLELKTTGEHRIEATVEGDIDPFIKAIARFTISDLVVEEPDLEESVLRLYSIPVKDSDEK
jgi:ABC-2 type transport system ATP-binding protein